MEENLACNDNFSINQNSDCVAAHNIINTNNQPNDSDPDCFNILCEDQPYVADDIIKNNINQQSHKKEASIEQKITYLKKKQRSTKKRHAFGKKMVKKQLEFRHVQSSLILIASKQFYLNGDIYIDLNQEFTQFTHISPMNLYKTPSFVIDNKALGELQIDIYSTQKCQDNFLELAEYFLNQPNKNLHFLGEQLIIHQEKVILMKNISHMIAAMPLHDQFLEACEKSFQTFRIESNKKVRQMIEDSTIKFYKTMVVKINYNLGTYEIVSMAISQALLALLGISTEQASSFVMRKGIFDYNFTMEEFTYQIFFLNIFNKENKVNKEYSSSRVLLTFDGIEVACQANTILMENTDNFITQKMGVNISEFMLVVDYDVTPSMLRKVMQIRDNQSSSLNNKLCLENESDWNYAVQYREFLDQFYPDEVA